MRNRLPLLKIRIPGQWADGLLHGDTLTLWTLKGRVYHIPVSRIMDWIWNNYGPRAIVAAATVIFRQNPVFMEYFSDYEKSFFLEDDIIIELPPVDEWGKSQVAYEGYLLDIEIYRNRIFSATERGAYETVFQPRQLSAYSEPIQISESPTYSIRARYNKLAVAQKSSGLFLCDVTLGEGLAWKDQIRIPKAKKFDDYADEVSFSTHSLLSYGKSAFPEVIPLSKGIASLKLQANDLPTYAYSIAQPLSKILSSNSKVEIKLPKPNLQHEPSSTEETRVVGNSDGRLLAVTKGTAKVVKLDINNAENLALKPDRKIQEKDIEFDMVDSALSVQPLKSGFLLEGFDNTAIVIDSGSQIIINEPRVRLRSFCRPSCVSDSFLAVADDFVELIGFSSSGYSQESRWRL